MPYRPFIWHDSINRRSVYGFPAFINKVMWDTYGNITMFGLTVYLGTKFGGRHGFSVNQGYLKREGDLSTKSICTEHSYLQSTMIDRYVRGIRSLHCHPSLQMFIVLLEKWMNTPKFIQQIELRTPRVLGTVL